jgi:hypothetical protein
MTHKEQEDALGERADRVYPLVSAHLESVLHVGTLRHCAHEGIHPGQRVQTEAESVVARELHTMPKELQEALLTEHLARLYISAVRKQALQHLFGGGGM